MSHSPSSTKASISRLTMTRSGSTMPSACRGATGVATRVRDWKCRGGQVGVVGLGLATDDGRVAQVVLWLEELFFERPAAPVALAPPVVDEHLHPGASPEPP